jgi:broad specificity phosphatase PhoE
MNTKIYLVRHGETEWNSTNRFQGSTDVPLSQHGIEQAKRVADKLKNYNIEVIASSDLSRAFNTAKELADIINVKIDAYEGFRELSFGEWEGLTAEEILKLYGDNYRTWRTTPTKAIIPVEGSLEAASKRGLKALNEVVNNNLGKTIAVFAHASIIKATILAAIGADLDLYNKFWLGNTAVNILEFRDSNYILSMLNDITHLQ